MESERKDQVLENYQRALEAVEAHLEKFMERPLEETLNGLSEFEQAKFKTMMAYAGTTLSLCYLRSKGQSVESHINMRHLERLKSYFTKIDKYIDLSADSNQ